MIYFVYFSPLSFQPIELTFRNQFQYSWNGAKVSNKWTSREGIFQKREGWGDFIRIPVKVAPAVKTESLVPKPPSHYSCRNRGSGPSFSTHIEICQSQWYTHISSLNIPIPFHSVMPAINNVTWRGNRYNQVLTGPSVREPHSCHTKNSHEPLNLYFSLSWPISFCLLHPCRQRQ